MFIFEASRKQEGKKKTIEINLTKATLSYGRHHNHHNNNNNNKANSSNNKPKIAFQFKDIYQCIKSQKEKTKVAIYTNSMTTTTKEESKFYFKNMETRERFCEIMWLGLCGVTSFEDYSVSKKKERKKFNLIY